jgi:hypothetical protein
MRLTFTALTLVCVLFPLVAAGQTAAGPDQKPLRLAIAGLNHGHVSGFIGNAKRRTNLVGVYDPDKELLDRYAYKLSIFSRYGFSLAQSSVPYFSVPLNIRCSR